MLADRPVEGCECDIVSVDTKQVTKDSLDLLLSKGYERILFATRQIGTNGIRRERFDEFSTQYEALTNRQAMTLEYTKADKESLKTAILSAWQRPVMPVKSWLYLPVMVLYLVIWPIY